MDRCRRVFLELRRWVFLELRRRVLRRPPSSGDCIILGPLRDARDALAAASVSAGEGGGFTGPISGSTDPVSGMGAGLVIGVGFFCGPTTAAAGLLLFVTVNVLPPLFDVTSSVLAIFVIGKAADIYHTIRIIHDR